MANWYGVARTNYVKVIPERKQQLISELAEWNIHIASHNTDPNLVVFLPFQTEDGDFTYTRTVVPDDETLPEIQQEFDWATNVIPYLEEGEVLVVMTIGNEKLRYLTGHAVAYRANKEPVTIGLDEIYQRAANTFGKNVDEITRAEY